MSDDVTAELTTKQRAAIVALLVEGDASKAAAAAGVSRQSLYRWMKQPVFAAELRAAEGEALRSLARQLAGLGDAAAAAVRDGLKEEQAIAVRLRAAALHLEKLGPVMDLADLVERVTQLEDRLNEHKD